jgi:3-hydroxybutyryl-CoA dehydratase
MAFTEFHIYFDDVEIGQTWVTPGRTITEADIVNFAGLSGDFNPIHLNHEYARTMPFRRPIAHGLLGIAISSGISLFSPPMRTLAFLSIKEWNFLAPIFIGDTIHGESTVLEKEPRSRGRRGVITWRRRLYNQEKKIVQEGITQTLVEGRGVLKEAPPHGAQGTVAGAP